LRGSIERTVLHKEEEIWVQVTVPLEDSRVGLDLDELAINLTGLIRGKGAEEIRGEKGR